MPIAPAFPGAVSADSAPLGSAYSTPSQFAPAAAPVEYEEPGGDEPVDEVAPEPEPTPEPAADATPPKHPVRKDDDTEPIDFEKSEKEPEPAIEEAVEFDADILKEAANYGWDEAEAKEFGTRSKLLRAMAAQDRQLSELARQMIGQQTQPESNGKAPEQAPPATTQQQVAAAQSALEKFKPDLNPELWDESQAKVVNDLNDHYHSLVEKLHNELAQEREARASIRDQFSQITSAQQAAEAAREEHEFETFFANLGDEYEDTFGKGDWKTLPPNSPALANRNKLWEETKVLRYAEGIRNRQPATQELQQRALRSLFPDKLKTIVRNELTAKVEKQRSQAIARPAGRQPKPPSPEVAAKAAIAEILRARGEDDREMEEEFLT